MELEVNTELTVVEVELDVGEKLLRFIKVSPCIFQFSNR